MSRSYILSILFSILLLLASCSSNTNTKDLSTTGASESYVCPMRCQNSAASQPGKCPVCHMLLVKSIEVEEMDTLGNYSNLSIYSDEYVWTNQKNQPLKLGNKRGRYQLVSTIFTHCEYACPNLISDMLNVDDDIKEEKRALLNFILISIDPERDTPKRLSAYANDMDLDNSRWSLLHGEVKAIDAIVSKLGVSYKRFENGAFGHSNVLTLLNPRGEIIYQLQGIHANREELVALINQL